MKRKGIWIKKQQKDVKKVFAPKIDYDKEFDILYIRWFPQFKYIHSLETDNGIIFDISEKPEQEVIGIQIMDFMKKLKLK